MKKDLDDENFFIQTPMLGNSQLRSFSHSFVRWDSRLKEGVMLCTRHPEYPFRLSIMHYTTFFLSFYYASSHIDDLAAMDHSHIPTATISGYMTSSCHTCLPRYCTDRPLPHATCHDIIPIPECQPPVCHPLNHFSISESLHFTWPTIDTNSLIADTTLTPWNADLPSYNDEQRHFPSTYHPQTFLSFYLPFPNADNTSP